ncbi:putative transmembrane protein, partial [Toxoplasma gondii MAS]
LLSYRHQTRREGRKELLALGFTGFSTAFAAAIHPFFFL